MSSPMNNNLLNQNMLASTGANESLNSRQGGGAGGSLSNVGINASRTQRSQHDSSSSLSSRRGRSNHANGRGRARKNSARTNDESNENSQQDNVLISSNQGVDSSTTTTTNNNNSSGRVIGYKSSRGGGGGGGKHRQRHQGNQLLEGMSSTTGLDIDFAESILPTGSSGRPSETGKGRHGTNSRKVNLSHLLNYRFERKQRGGYQHRGHQHQSSSHDGNSNFHHISSHYRDPGTFHKFNKQQFLQANCQFVVSKGPDYSVHKVDPDWPVDWNHIEEVKFMQSSSTETTCPICLEPPIAAKITRCGHIYCWTCMLQYLSLSDGSSRQCPICFESVHRNELRSVVSHSFTNHAVDEVITMKLMVRKKGCVEVEPYRKEFVRSPIMDMDFNTEPSPQPPPPSQPSLTGDEHYFSSANLVIVDSATVISKIVQRERRELLFKYEMDKDEPEVCFIEQALVELKKRKETLESNATQETNQVQPPYQETLRERNSELSKSYLFYQCSDNQHIYLNPFSTKILCQEYESLENCPLEIRANILQMDWISMSEAWRKRFRYLEHLPLTCEFRLIEIDFEHSNLVSPETFSMFADQIRRREQEREFRRREERKREKIIQVEQNRRIYGIQPSLKINLNNTDQFPSVSDERYLGLRQRRHQSRSNELVSTDDDEEDEVENLTRSNLSSTTNASPAISEAIVSPEVSDTVSNMALSFRDIQLQEAEKESRLAGSSSSHVASNAWSSKKPGSSTSANSSSFAQLLVNAKSSQKEWTRSSGSKTTTTTTSKPGTQKTNGESEDDDEEVRAPPSEFTLSDFINTNVTASIGRKKGKPKVVSKK